jgi:hypothetical protein
VVVRVGMEGLGYAFIWSRLCGIGIGIRVRVRVDLQTNVMLWFRCVCYFLIHSNRVVERYSREVIMYIYYAAILPNSTTILGRNMYGQNPRKVWKQDAVGAPISAGCGLLEWRGVVEDGKPRS